MVLFSKSRSNTAAVVDEIRRAYPGLTMAECTDLAVTARYDVTIAHKMVQDAAAAELSVSAYLALLDGAE